MKALSVQHLTKRFKKITALNDVSFDVESGDFFALLGPNGAGKSTTIGIITSLINKTEGKILVYGHDTDKAFDEAKKNIGLIPQEFNCNIFEKCIDVLICQAGYYGIPRNIAKTRAEHYLKKLDLWYKRDATVRELSGGMKRRLMIARGLIHQPKLLILDEPTAGVDIEIRQIMWQFIREINEAGTTIILTTHYLEEAENLCRNIAIIDHGKIIENTSMNNLLRKLNVETLVFYLANPIYHTPNVAPFACRLINETTLEVDITKEYGLNDLFAKLSEQNINVLSMRNKANRLETLFLDMIKKPNQVVESNS